jgi:preprotein translocase subunit SecD
MAKLTDYIKDRRIASLIAIAVILILLDLHFGIHFGIEFVGGTQIPLTLDRPLNATAMSTLVSALDQRVSTFGLKQVTVEGIGNSNVYVVIPTVSASEINSTISVIDSQGIFEGVVNGQVALNGSGILHSSIGIVPPTTVNNSVQWAVTFYVTQAGANKFAKVVFGAANKPLYMFLDRPVGAAILMNSSILNINTTITPSTQLADIKQVLTMAARNDTIPVVTVSNNNASVGAAESFLEKNPQYKNIFASYNLPKALIAFLKAGNYTVHLESTSNMTPLYETTGLDTQTLEEWPMVGLLSAPILNPSITNGNVSDSYEISGVVPTTVPRAQMVNYANNQSKTIASILSGGALPVGVIVGTPTLVSPTLGKGSLEVSLIALIMAVVFVSIFITIRYRKRFLVIPILMTTLMELFIIVSIIGLIGTIDLAAVAGMIAVVGTGVDAQIIITDEVLIKRTAGSSTKLLLGNAFYIVWADAALLVIAMLPLLFSTSLVSIIGFSESTIIGALMGIFITRPAYGALISKHFG